MQPDEFASVEPADLTRLTDAIYTYKRSREWFKARMKFYYKGSPLTAYVSQSDIDAAHVSDNRTRTSYPKRED